MMKWHSKDDLAEKEDLLRGRLFLHRISNARSYDEYTRVRREFADFYRQMSPRVRQLLRLASPREYSQHVEYSILDRRLRRFTTRAARAHWQASTMLDWSTAWLPPKIVDEVVGNSFERMEKMHDEGVSHWRIQAYALRRIFWCYVYTLRDVGVLAIVWRFLGG